MSLKPFKKCSQCGELIAVRNRLGIGVVIEEHGSHSCDCEYCDGFCPGSRSIGEGEVVEIHVGPRWRGPKAPRRRVIEHGKGAL